MIDRIFMPSLSIYYIGVIFTEQRTTTALCLLVYKILLLARVLGLKAARPSVRATIGYILYNAPSHSALRHVVLISCTLEYYLGTYLYTRYPNVARHARPSASREQRYIAYKVHMCSKDITEFNLNLLV